MPAGPAEAAALRNTCDIRIGFPRGDAGTPADWLRAIADFVEAEKVSDEIYMAGELAGRLEDYCADLMGKPATLWFPTGTMAQMAAALIHAGATGRSTIGLHPTSHLLLHEDDGISELAGLTPVRIGEWSRVIEARDVEQAGDLACLFIELPQRHNGGLCPDWQTLNAAIDAARAGGARLHMDGARLWSTREAMGGRSYAEICAPFDSVYASFYKEVGALGGAILAGDEDFIEEARLWRHRQGGLQVRGWPLMADAMRRLPSVIDAMPDWINGAREIAALIHECGFDIEPLPVQTNMFHVRLSCAKADFADLRDRIAREMKVWIGGSGWDLDGRPGMSLEIAVDGILASADRSRLRAAFERLAELQG
ncbi:beta-eliminating lyase-related protein [Hyphobacterium sp. HN65]|uniref:Beta-eliminating lyase-related protein n=1 Tax=Hyphobacterium lacteum TaxID=3116575 RepID=A0ABU7LR21_9PROT|nr:beta-eliminating lyase-related protein [Hyphobacterium sp. HN65]MEE2526081.1 beta-eliminating lyase-related protein [Hyphobacterium sp. HN65]